MSGIARRDAGEDGYGQWWVAPKRDFDPSLLSDAELDIAEALIAKATGRQPRKPETLARIAEG
jgi:hypothetical protein